MSNEGTNENTPNPRPDTDARTSAESILTLMCRESIHFAQFANDTCVGTSF